MRWNAPRPSVVNATRGFFVRQYFTLREPRWDLAATGLNFTGLGNTARDIVLFAGGRTIVTGAGNVQTEVDSTAIDWFDVECVAWLGVGCLVGSRAQGRSTGDGPED